MLERFDVGGVSAVGACVVCTGIDAPDPCRALLRVKTIIAECQVDSGAVGNCAVWFGELL